MSSKGPIKSLSPAKGKAPSTPNSKEKRYQVKQDFSSPQSYKVATTLIKAPYILALKKLSKALQKEIKDTIDQIYSHVLLRRPAEGAETFFIHGMSTALFEAFSDEKIKNKDHQKKIGGIFNKIINTLETINRAFANPRLSHEQQEVLRNYQAEFMKQHDVCVTGIKKLSDEMQKHLKKYASIDITKLNRMPLTPTKRQRINTMHPQTPTPEKVPFAQKRTPKRLSAESRASIRALQELLDSPIRPVQQPNFAPAVVPSVDATRLIPRALLTKRTLHVSFQNRMAAIPEIKPTNPEPENDSSLELKLK